MKEKSGDEVIMCVSCQVPHKRSDMKLDGGRMRCPYCRQKRREWRKAQSESR